MANPYVSSNTAIPELTTNNLDHLDDQVLQAFVTAGALVALSDGQVKAVERDKLVSFVDKQGFVPTISRHEIGEAFDDRVRQLEDRRLVMMNLPTKRSIAALRKS